jgi:hypothetical protein
MNLRDFDQNKFVCSLYFDQFFMFILNIFMIKIIILLAINSYPSNILI